VFARRQRITPTRRSRPALVLITIGSARADAWERMPLTIGGQQECCSVWELPCEQQRTDYIRTAPTSSSHRRSGASCKFYPPALSRSGKIIDRCFGSAERLCHLGASHPGSPPMPASSAHVLASILHCECKLGARRSLLGARVDARLRLDSSDPFRSAGLTPCPGSHERTSPQYRNQDAVRRRLTCFRKLASWMCAPMGTANARRR
jgi:hypothetical protein